MENYVGKSIMANLFRGIESVGGKIYFYESYLEFKAHALNIQKGVTQIKYADIDSIIKRNTLGIVPNGILIVLKSGDQYKFVINNRNKVIEFMKTR